MWLGLLVVVVSMASSDAIEFKQKPVNLFGSGVEGESDQGQSVALSEDGSTLAIGGHFDGAFVGATWVFVRDDVGNWVQQGEKLVGGNGSDYQFQGGCVSLSLDGNTLAVGGSTDSTEKGATWIFKREGGTWIQGGQKLVAIDAYPTANQGSAVSLSGDGKVLAVGAYKSGKQRVGATWIFRQSGSDGAWVVEPEPIIGTDNIEGSEQGIDVALSENGNTLAVGGFEDNGSIGATWVFEYTPEGGWKQEGKLVGGEGTTARARQGHDVDLSWDGNILAIGESAAKYEEAGGAWVFERSAPGIWNQVGKKLVGQGKGGTQHGQGYSVAITRNGSFLAVGDYDGENIGVKNGATWLFERKLSGEYSQVGGALSRKGNGKSLPAAALDMSSDGCTLAVGAIAGRDETRLGGTLLYTSNSAGCPYFTANQPTEGISKLAIVLIAILLGAVIALCCCCLICFLARRRKKQQHLPTHKSGTHQDKDSAIKDNGAKVGSSSRTDVDGDDTATLITSTGLAEKTLDNTLWTLDFRTLTATAGQGVSSDEPVEFLKAQLDALHKSGELFLDHFRIGDRRERRVGGKGVVQFATNKSSKILAKDYAIKFFLDRQSFDAECHQLKNSKLWHIMPVIDSVVDNDDGKLTSLGRPLPPMIVVEKGESLDEYQRRCEANFAASMNIILQLVECVVEMHAAGVVHRDLKPANVISYPMRNAWNLIDFGEAADAGSVAPLACSLSYAAPETILSLMNGKKRGMVDPAVDAWALGIIAYELLTRSRVFPANAGCRQSVEDAMSGKTPLEWESVDDPAWATKLRRLGWMKDGVLSLLRRDTSDRAALSDVLLSWRNHLK